MYDNLCYEQGRTMKSKRELSKSQQYVNLYIQYMRDHEKDTYWQGVTNYKYNEKLGFDIFVSHDFIPRLEYYRNIYDPISDAYEHESDGRKKKSRLKELNEELPVKNRFDELIKEKKFRENCKRLGLGFNDFCWESTQNEYDNKLCNNHGLVNIRGIDVEPEILTDFIRDFNDTVSVFKIKKPFKDPTLVFELMGSFWTDGDNQEDGAEIEKSLKIWSVFCRRVEKGKNVIKTGYYNQSKQKALENLETLENVEALKNLETLETLESIKYIDLIRFNQYWLLKLLLEHEKIYGKQISFKPELIKKRRLIKLLEKWFNRTTIERLYKNLQK